MKHGSSVFFLKLKVSAREALADLGVRCGRGEPEEVDQGVGRPRGESEGGGREYSSFQGMKDFPEITYVRGRKGLGVIW